MLIVFAICPLFVAPPIGWFYLGTAVVLAAAQLAALPDFRRRDPKLIRAQR